MTWIKAADSFSRIPKLIINRSFSFDFDGIPLQAENISNARLINLLMAGLDDFLKNNHVMSLPPVIQIEPTNICNLKCPLCPTGANTSYRKKGVMSLETFSTILSELSSTLLAVYLYSYGEPTINEKLHHMIKACTDHNILTLTTTNGHFIQSPEEALSYVDSGLTVLIIAVDGSSQEIYQEYRRTGELEKVKKCIRYIEEAKRLRGVNHPYTVMRSVVMQQNMADLPHLEQMARDFGVNMFAGKSLGCQPGSNDFQDYQPENENLQRFGKERMTEDKETLATCPFPFRQPTIFWDGTLVGSEHDHELELPLGKMGEKSFRQMWNGPKAIKLRRAIRTGTNLPKFCSPCPHEGRSESGVELFCKELKSV